MFCLKVFSHPRVETQMASLALSNLDRASSKLSSVEKRKDVVERQIKVQIEAYALVPKGIESNPTIIYYTKERERVSIKQDTELTALETKIRTIEAKKQAAIDKFDADLEALEAKKTALQNTLKSEAERYTSEIQRVTEKLEDPEPQTPAFRRLKADLANLVLEEITAQEEFQEANAKYRDEHDKQSRRQMAEQQLIWKQHLAAERLKEQEEREKIERVKDQERQAEMDRAIKRAEEAKAKGPVKPYIIKIHPNTPYSIKELLAMKKDDFDEEENTLWDNKYGEAQYREGIKKWDVTEIVAK